MADEKDTPTEADAEGGGNKSKMKMIIIIAAAVAVLGGGGAGAYFMLGGGEQDAEAAAKAEAEGAVETVINLELDPFLVNLADTGGKHYLKTRLTLELGSEETVAWINARLPRVRDSILMLLSSKESQDLLTAKGKFGLRDEVLDELNNLNPKGKIDAVYLTEFVVQ